jgi:hypothetical protein
LCGTGLPFSLGLPRNESGCGMTLRQKPFNPTHRQTNLRASYLLDFRPFIWRN